MEDELDEIATAKEDMVKVLDEFYYPFQDALKSAETQMERVQIPTSEICHVCGAPMVLKFGRTGQFLGCSKYPECKATRPAGRCAAGRGGSQRACLPQVRQAALDSREQAEREVSLLLGLSRLQGIVQHRRERQPRAVARRDRARLREVRQADGSASGPARALPGLHGLSQVPQRRRGRQRGQARPDGQDRRQVREVRQADGRASGPARGLPRLHGLSQVPRHGSRSRRAERAARRAAPGRTGELRSGPENDRGSRDLRRLRQLDGRPPRPSRLLPGLRQVSQVQRDEGAQRSHAGQDSWR